MQLRPETLARILAAAVERPSLVLARERRRVLELAGHRGAGAVRVFGSIAQGTGAAGSDIDLLVTFAPDASLLDAAGLVLGYRVRVGDYRIIYTIRNDILVVVVVTVGHRRDVYE